MFNNVRSIFEILVACFGIFFGFWYVSIVGYVIALIYGDYIVALSIGLFLDLLWGSPAGFFHILIYPWTLLAMIYLTLRYLLLKQFRSRVLDHI